jgi:hypothetical protein
MAVLVLKGFSMALIESWATKLSRSSEDISSELADEWQLVLPADEPESMLLDEKVFEDDWPDLVGRWDVGEAEKSQSLEERRARVKAWVGAWATIVSGESEAQPETK